MEFMQSHQRAILSQMLCHTIACVSFVQCINSTDLNDVSLSLLNREIELFGKKGVIQRM